MKNSTILFFLLFSFNAAFAQMPNGKEKITSSDTAFEQELVRLVNEERKKRSLKPLAWDEKLAYAARYHASDMIKDQYFKHESYDRNYKKLKKIGLTFDRLRKFTGTTYTGLSENIGAGQTSAKEMVKVWMNSSGHRANILDEKAKFIGVGYIYSEEDPEEMQHYWVMDAGY